MRVRVLTGDRWWGVMLVTIFACAREDEAASFGIRIGPDGVVETSAGPAADREGRYAAEARLIASTQEQTASWWVVAADARRWRESRRDGDGEFRLRLDVQADQILGALADLIHVVSILGVEGPLDADVFLADGEYVFTLREPHEGLWPHGYVEGFDVILNTSLALRSDDQPGRVLMSEDRQMIFGGTSEMPNLAARLDALAAAGDPVLVSLSGGEHTTVAEIRQSLGPWLDAPNWRLFVWP